MKGIWHQIRDEKFIGNYDKPIDWDYIKNKFKMKEKLAQKMLDEKLDFLSLEDSLKLKKEKVLLDTQFSWVVCTEELPDNGWGMSNKEIIDYCDEIYGENHDYIRVGKAYDEFSEFTLELCPAPTYTDLL